MVPQPKVLHQAGLILIDADCRGGVARGDGHASLRFLAYLAYKPLHLFCNVMYADTWTCATGPATLSRASSLMWSNAQCREKFQMAETQCIPYSTLHTTAVKELEQLDTYIIHDHHRNA
jgi:hypothetical protein